MKITVFLAIAVSAPILAACTTATPIYTQDGRKGYSISCNGGANSWGSCAEKAGEICGASGYDVFTRDGEATTMGVLSSSGGVIGGRLARNMVISCKS